VLSIDNEPKIILVLAFDEFTRAFLPAKLKNEPRLKK
jgi:hypothetical protein